VAAIERVGEADLEHLLPLMRAYCEFYGVDPPDAALLAMSRELIADSEREGLQLLAREDSGRAIGFATIFWSWSTLRAECCRRRGGVASLGWQTAGENRRAQAVYKRVGAKRSEWLDYSLPI